MLMFEERTTDISTSTEQIKISYTRCCPPERLKPKGTVVLLHDFLQTSYQFRHVIDLFAMGGYIAIAPDLLRNHQASRKQPKTQLSRGKLCHHLTRLLDHLNVLRPIHLVGQGLGGEIAVHFNFLYPERLASITWSGTSPLGGHTPPSTENAINELSKALQNRHPNSRAIHSSSTPNSIFNELIQQETYNQTTFSNEDFAEYIESLSVPGTIETLSELHRNAKSDAQELRDLLNFRGQSSTPSCLLVGEHSLTEPIAGEILFQLFQETSSRIAVIEDSKSFLAEEQPESYALRILAFMNSLTTSHSSRLNSGYIEPKKSSIPPRL